MFCSRCGSPMIALFTSLACKAECDLDPFVQKRTLVGEEALAAILRHQALHRLDSFGGAVWFSPKLEWWRRTRFDPPDWRNDGPIDSVQNIHDWFYLASSDAVWEPCDPPSQ